ncbi:helix-turn-helix domain-containing protein, partial [Acinetobacter baumannii]
MNALELQERLDLPKPTVYRLLAGLVPRGLIYSYGDPRQYRLGVNALKLAHAWSQSFEIGSESEPVLNALSSRTGETAALFL